MKNCVTFPILLSLSISSCGSPAGNNELPPPNILWVSCEDITTMLGSYGDPNASTPHLDAFTKQGVLFSNAYATAPACAPARSSLITGVNAISLGTQHLRSELNIPDHIKPFPKYLREAGYFATNNSKEDYNFNDNTIWDNSSPTAHWRERGQGQPFFSVFNLGATHQSQIFGDDSRYEEKISRFLPHIKRTSPENLILPPYYPDSPEIRKLWARYYTNVSIIDYQFSELLKELEDDGLTDNTIVIFFSDHGTGVPRGKRAAYDSGLKVPLLMRIPEQYARKYNMNPGTVDHRMVSFLDFAPSMLRIAGIPIPSDWYGKPLIPGSNKDQHAYVFGYSDRVDEGFDVARTIRTPKYRYVRNFLPHLPLIQPNLYTDQSNIMQELFRINRETHLTGPELIMFNPRRTVEELYDIENDPHEIYNLAYDSNYGHIINDMRTILTREIIRNFDTGLMPEPEMHRLSETSSPYEISRDPSVFPAEEILAACDLMLEPDLNPEVVLKKLRHQNGFVRYWTVIAVQERGFNNEDVNQELRKLLSDNFPTVQIQAAKTLINSGSTELSGTITQYMKNENSPLVLYATRAFQQASVHFTEVPVYIDTLYEQLKVALADQNNHTEYYKLYSYWALTDVLDKKAYSKPVF